jgi:hypothetical protein
MCLSLYIAAPRPLPLVEWNIGDPGFHVIEVPERLDAVRKHFQHPHVYYVGSREGCSCAFNYEHDDRAILELRNYLRTALEVVDQLEGFVCRVGCEAAEAQHWQITSPEGVALADFYFREAQYLVIQRSGTGNASSQRVERRDYGPPRIVEPAQSS